MQEVDALQSLDLPMRAGALLVRDENIEQSFRKMSHRTGGLHIHLLKSVAAVSQMMASCSRGD